jgi:hypothetical protein
LLNFQSARNATKTVPLRPSRLPDSGGIFTFANGVRMEEISRSVRQAKQAKIWDADCTCPYSPYGHVEGRTIMMTWQFDDVAFLLVVGLANRMLTRVIWANNMRTRGPIHGRHVSLFMVYMVVICKMIWGVRGVRPPDLPQHQSLCNTPLANIPANVSLLITKTFI